MINPIRSFVPTTDPSFLTSSFPLPMLGSHRKADLGPTPNVKSVRP